MKKQYDSAIDGGRTTRGMRNLSMLDVFSTRRKLKQTGVPIAFVWTLKSRADHAYGGCMNVRANSMQMAVSQHEINADQQRRLEQRGLYKDAVSKVSITLLRREIE